MRLIWTGPMFLCGLLVAVNAQDATAKRDLEAVLARRASAMQANRPSEIVKFFGTFTTPDYSHNGNPREVLLSALRQNPTRMFVIKAAYQIDNLTVNSNTARTSVACKEYNPVMEPGVTGPYKARNWRETSWTERIVWVKVAQQGWRMKTLDETSEINRDKVVAAVATNPVRR